MIRIQAFQIPILKAGISVIVHPRSLVKAMLNHQPMAVNNLFFTFSNSSPVANLVFKGIYLIHLH
jgi:hypothetical protein